MKQFPNKLARLPLSAWMLSGALLLGISLLIATANWQRVENLLTAMKLLPQPETYTELYFSQQLQLPKTSVKQPLTFGFTVHNLEGRATNYPFVVVAQAPGGQPQVLSSGFEVLGSGQSQSQMESVVLPKDMKTAEISVILTDQNEAIHFWVGASS